MVVYSIKDLETLSGIKAHTLRIWEKRYNLISPKRTDTNIRYYTEEDLRGLLNICFLYNKGYKISKIAVMCPLVIKEKVSSYSHLELDFSDQLDALMLFILDLDEYNFNKILDQHLDQKGLENTMNDLIYPLLDKLNLAWISGSFMNVHESFVSQIIRSKIIASTEKLNNAQSDHPKYMIYLPPGEKQELSMLYLHFILKKMQCGVVNLGSDVILSEVIAARESARPDYVLTIINEGTQNLPFREYVAQLDASMGNAKLLITGFKAVSEDTSNLKSVISLASLQEVMEYCQSNKSPIQN